MQNLRPSTYVSFREEWISQKKFEEATWCKTVSIGTLELNHKYPIIRAKRITTKIGSTVLMTIRDSQEDPAQTFLQKRYSDIMSDDDIQKLHKIAVFLYLPYRGVCVTSKSYFLAIEA